MKKIIVLLLTALCGFGFTLHFQESFEPITNHSFSKGEVLEYRVHYGFLNAGEGIVEVSPNIFKVNNRPCYKINVSGKSVGPFDLMLRIRDTWRTYVDTSTMNPQRFYVNIQEGRYRKEENVYFNYDTKKIRSEEVNHETKEFDLPRNVQDLISGYYYLRNVNFDRLANGDLILVKAFFDDGFYDFKVRYRGRGEANTKWGKVRCIKLTPVMPDNKLFNGENSIRVWITDDKNRIPVKVEADMFVGAVELDLKRFKNLRHPTILND